MDIKKSLTLCNIIVVIAMAGCCPHPSPDPQLPSAVAVREQQLRFDAHLPLQAGDSSNLLKFLAAGGDRHLIGEDAVLPGAAAQYGPLLALLSKPENLHMSDLSGKNYVPWFSKKPTFQVIDARDTDVPVPGTVIAYSDTRFWWIFHQKDGTLIQLIVIKAGPSNK